MALRSIENLQRLRSRSRRRRQATPPTTNTNLEVNQTPTGRSGRGQRRQASPFAILEDAAHTARPRSPTSRRLAVPRRPFISRSRTNNNPPLLASMVPSTTWGPFVDDTTDPTNITVTTHFTAAVIPSSSTDPILDSISVMDTCRQFSKHNPRDPWAQYLAMALVRHIGYVRAFASPTDDQATHMTPSHERAYQKFRTEFERALVDRRNSATVTTTNTNNDYLIPSPPARTMQRLANLERNLTKHAFLAWPRLWQLCNATNQRCFVELTALFRILEDVVGAPRRTSGDGWERGMRMLRKYFNHVFMADWIELGDVLALMDTDTEQGQEEGEGEGNVSANTARNDLDRRQKAQDMCRTHYEYLWSSGMGERMYRERLARRWSLRLRLEKEKKDREREQREKWGRVVMLR